LQTYLKDSHPHSTRSKGTRIYAEKKLQLTDSLYKKELESPSLTIRKESNNSKKKTSRKLFDNPQKEKRKCYIIHSSR